MRILCLGDSPYRRTGFGIVNEVAIRHLLALGHEVIVIGAQDSDEMRVPYSPKMTFITTHDGNPSGPDDMMGWTKSVKVIEQYKPDAVHIMGDPAMITSWMMHRHILELPTVAYVPIEGAPLNLMWVDSFRNAPNLRLITCSNYGVDVLKSYGIDSWMAYHGVSEDFQPISEQARAAWRYRLSWNDKFVVMCVAQNVGRKQWPRLFEAIALASKRVPNLMLYAHTVPFNGYWLDGHDLPQLATQMGIWERVVFPPTHQKHNDSMTLKSSTEDLPGLTDLYGAADMFVLPSQVEGFGLPLAEAMACGLPVAHTDYAAGAEVIGSAGIKLPVLDWVVNRSHSRYANVAPRDIAEAIVRVAKSPEYAKQLSRRSIERAKMFTWDSYRSTLEECFSEEWVRSPQAIEEFHPGLQAVG